ncbi:glycoside hydrolase family 16 protein [Pedobacter sp. R-06]|uniref:glycoside hydrolase family 16 protein n=1 Tax=Pedobacter sp. R-06 TaxID=3404051 RepID=UPI003CF9EA28
MNKQVLIPLFCMVALNCFAQSDGIKRKLIWSDEFDYTGLPDAKKWTYEQGFVRNKEPQFYTKNRLENVRVENGNLVIEAKKEEFEGAHFTSASVITLGKQHFKYGRIEVRAKVCKGVGAWPAIWMLGTNRGPVKWPNCGEIDILEFVGKDSTQVYGTVHYTDSTNNYKYQGEKPVVGRPWQDFHVYAINWDQDKIEFYYDDLKYMVFDIKKADNAVDNPFRKEFYLLLNLALGRQGTLGGPLKEEILPLKYEVDYVRIYKSPLNSKK